MIAGTVTAQREAVIRLQVQDANGQIIEVDVILDTGYTGSLTLPAAVIAKLGLALRGTREVVLADGSHVMLDAYRAIVLWDGWDGSPRTVLVLASEGDVLIGMSMFYGHDVRLHVVDGGSVQITPLSAP